VKYIAEVTNLWPSIIMHIILLAGIFQYDLNRYNSKHSVSYILFKRTAL